MKIRILTLLLLAAALTACNNKSIRVSPVDNDRSNETNVFYSLPRTIIHVNVSCIQSQYIPGPYAAYAKKYLGIEGVSTSEKVEFTIDKIDFEIASEADPKAVFAVYPAAKGYGNYLSLTHEGLILPITQSTTGKTFTMPQEQKSHEVPFKDISMSPFITEESSTFYGRTLRDSVYVRVPIQRTLTVERNLEEKAKEASDFIFNLRKKRLDFLTPEVDHPFSGDALQVILKEIQRLEDEYLSLFIGKRYTYRYIQSFSYVPSNADGESSILFRFSDSKGILQPNDLSGRPIIIELDQPEYPEGFDATKTKIETFAEKAKLDRFYYRIPVNTNVRINDGKQQLAVKRVSIYQYGILTQLPTNYPGK